MHSGKEYPTNTLYRFCLAFTDRLPGYLESTVLPSGCTDVCEPEEVERLWLTFTTIAPVLYSESAKLNEPGFPWMQSQRKGLKSFTQILQESFSFMLVLEAHDEVIRVS